MAIDIAKVKARLSALSSNNQKTNNLWKPSEGTSIIRIVPYKFQPDFPFIELLFHYGINKKTYLSPSSFGRPDPIVEFAETLKKSGDKDEWKMGNKLLPKLRTYVPIIVRGEEKEGVKFWGFGKQVSQELLSIIADDDYGDIADLKTGRDIAVEFKAAPADGKSFPETSIRVKPKQTVASDDKDVLVKINNQKDILTLFPEPSYDELKKALETWLNPQSAEEAPVVVPDGEDAGDEASVSPTADKAKTNSAKTPEEIASEFDDIFNEDKK